MTNALPWDLVNMANYPIDNLDTQRGRTVVDNARRSLDEAALCLLPGFLSSQAIAALCAEAEQLIPSAIPYQRDRTAYGWMDNRGFPPEHPRSAMFASRNQTVTLNQMAPDSLFRQLFFFDALTEFVRQALGFDTLYCSACPYLAIELKVMDAEDVLSWHFDTNDGVVSLLLQGADEGGNFQYAPYIRSEEDERYEDIAAVFEERSNLVKQPPMQAGSLVLFKGRRSLHRVSPVGKTRQPRLILLLSYDREPDMVFPQATVRSITQPDGVAHRGTVS